MKRVIGPERVAGLAEKVSAAAERVAPGAAAVGETFRRLRDRAKGAAHRFHARFDPDAGLLLALEAFEHGDDAERLALVGALSARFDERREEHKEFGVYRPVYLHPDFVESPVFERVVSASLASTGGPVRPAFVALAASHPCLVTGGTIRHFLSAFVSETDASAAASLESVIRTFCVRVRAETDAGISEKNLFCTAQWLTDQAFALLPADPEGRAVALVCVAVDVFGPEVFGECVRYGGHGEELFFARLSRTVPVADDRRAVPAGLLAYRLVCEEPAVLLKYPVLLGWGDAYLAARKVPDDEDAAAALYAWNRLAKKVLKINRAAAGQEGRREDVSAEP